MTIIIEAWEPLPPGVDPKYNSFAWKPVVYRSRLQLRIIWGWYAISFLYIPYIEFLKTDKQWIVDGKDVLEGRG